MRTHQVILALFVASPLLVGPAAHGQQDVPARRAIYFELLGNGGVASLNYEQEWRPRTLLRAGIAAWSAEDLWSDNEIRVIGVPLLALRLFGSGSHRLEGGGGVFVGHRDETQGASGTFAALTGVACYRFQRPGGGFVFRAAFTPFVSLSGGEHAYPEEGITPSVGISFGRAF
jgi:hypothetical protein